MQRKLCIAANKTINPIDHKWNIIKNTVWLFLSIIVLKWTKKSSMSMVFSMWVFRHTFPEGCFRNSSDSCPNIAH